MKLNDLVGLKIVAVKSNNTEKEKYKSPDYILFDDGQTYIELEEQDCYTYHDCSSSARQISPGRDKGYWKSLMRLQDANAYL